MKGMGSEAGKEEGEQERNVEKRVEEKMEKGTKINRRKEKERSHCCIHLPIAPVRL